MKAFEILIFLAFGQFFILAEAKKVGENCESPHKNAILESCIEVYNFDGYCPVPEPGCTADCLGK